MHKRIVRIISAGAQTLILLLLLIFTCKIAYSKCGVPTTHRGNSARYQFMRQTGYPHGRKGYVVDHILALCKGGKDSPLNMQWQSVKDAKAKDKIECVCKLDPKPVQQKKP